MTENEKNVEKNEAGERRCTVGILDILEWTAATMGHDGRSTAELRAWERSNGI